MKFNIVTIFPGIFDSYLNESILKRAQKNKLIKIGIHDLRDFSDDKRKKVDDRPFGGGPGMVLKTQPIVKAVEFIKNKMKSEKGKVILFTPNGKQFDNKIAAQLAKNCDNLILICGRYEGIDERVKKVIRNFPPEADQPRAEKLKIENLSIGPYVLTGGELAAMVLIDAVSRKIPGALGKEESLEEKRFGVGVPAYTRPAEFVYKKKKYKVPDVLLSGDHKKIAVWRKTRRRASFV